MAPWPGTAGATPRSEPARPARRSVMLQAPPSSTEATAGLPRANEATAGLPRANEATAGVPRANEATAGVPRASEASRGVGHRRWMICALLFFAATINYIDRQVIGL